MNKRCGDCVSTNEPYAYLYVNGEERLEEAQRLIKEAVRFTDEKPEVLPLVYDIIE